MKSGIKSDLMLAIYVFGDALHMFTFRKINEGTHQFLKTHRFDCLLVLRLFSGVRTCTKRRLLLYTMANQPGRGCAAARRAAAPPNTGRGSSAPPGARDPKSSGLVHMMLEFVLQVHTPSRLS